MPRRVIVPANATPSIGPFSAGISTGNLVFVSGQTAADAKGIEAQVRSSLEKLGAVLRAAGADYADVVRCGVYLKNINDFAAMNAIYKEFFSSQPPARSTIGCALVQPDILFEIDCVAQLPSRQ